MTRIVLVVVLCVFAAAVVPATAQVVEGGGTAATDCWVTFTSMPPANYPTVTRPSLGVKCSGKLGDCNGNTKVGYCSYQLQMTLNNTGFPAKCSPADLPVGAFYIPFNAFTDAANDDHPKNIHDFDQFQQFVDSKLELDGVNNMADRNVMSAFGPVTVPMQIGFTAKGPVFKSTTLSLHPTMCSVPLDSSHNCPSVGVLKDVDTFKFVCTPPLDPMGKPITACTGKDGNLITSTFQQIQEHIFDRKCSNVSACHGGMMSGNLCLSGDQCAGHTTYTDLVNVAPQHNVQAATDGLKRVDPGNPTNSLLVHKINGGVQLNSSNVNLSKAQRLGAYGSRMPYPYTHTSLPSGPIGRPKLSRGEIQLIYDWIAAGAPNASGGFVSTTALGACH